MRIREAVIDLDLVLIRLNLWLRFERVALNDLAHKLATRPALPESIRNIFVYLLVINEPFDMCHWYAHQFACGHVVYAFGKFCPSSALVRTACEKKKIWQFFLLDNKCEVCVVAHQLLIGSNKY